MVGLDIFHSGIDTRYGKIEKYIDLHIPKRFEEKFYFLIGYSFKNFELIIDLDSWLIWFKDHELMFFR